MKHNNLKTLILVGAAAVLGMGSVQAQTDLYNSTSYNGYAMGMTNGLQIGNPITVQSASLTQFQFEFIDTAGANLPANAGVQVQFFANDGPAGTNGYKTPQDLFYSSPWYYNTFGGLETTSIGTNLIYNATDFAAGSVNGWGPIYNYALPNNFTFTITWTNITHNEILMPLANNVPGQSTGFYWVNNNGTWTLNSQPNNDPNANFITDFTGQVPEPTTFGLAALGGAMLLGIQKLRRKV